MSDTQGGASPEDLRCEYLTDPLGIGEARPRLSWVVRAEGRGWTQGAFQILVAASAATLAEGRGDLWDSGKIATSRTAQIGYEGRPLAGRQTCFWKVRVWDGTDVSSAWSRVGRWEMDLLSEADWAGAVWIGGAASGGTGPDVTPTDLPPRPAWTRPPTCAGSSPCARRCGVRGCPPVASAAPTCS